MSAMPILSAVFGGKEVSPEEEMQKQAMQAQMLRNRAGPQHTTVLGTILGGIGGMGNQIGSDLQEGYQNGANFGKRFFGGGGMGGAGGGMPFSFGG